MTGGFVPPTNDHSSAATVPPVARDPGIIGS